MNEWMNEWMKSDMKTTMCCWSYQLINRTDQLADGPHLSATCLCLCLWPTSKLPPQRLRPWTLTDWTDISCECESLWGCCRDRTLLSRYLDNMSTTCLGLIIYCLLHTRCVRDRLTTTVLRSDLSKSSDNNHKLHTVVTNRININNKLLFPALSINNK